MIYVGALVGGVLGFWIQGKTLGLIFAVIGGFLGYVYQQSQKVSS